MTSRRVGDVVFDDEVLAGDQQRLAAVGDAPAIRVAYAAAHVILLDSYREVDHRDDAPGDPDEIAAHIDWPRTAAYRRHLAGYGFGIAEAMDTAQRFQLGYPAARRLIDECAASAGDVGFIAGASTDHRPAVEGPADLVDGVSTQIEQITRAGGIPIILPMPWLPRSGAGPDDYVDVYRGIIARARGPLLIHWLGPAFAPELAGYFPGDSFSRVMELDPSKVRGVKLSLLDFDFEMRIRRELLPSAQVVFTGDDYHFGGLIRGDDPAPRLHVPFGDRTIPAGAFSHALLGILDAIAKPAALALRLLDHGLLVEYTRIISRCEALADVIFEPPVSAYKAGLAFVAWLNGHQDQFLLVNHEQRRRDRDHYLRVAKLASAAGAIDDAERAGDRLEGWLAAGAPR